LHRQQRDIAEQQTIDVHIAPSRKILGRGLRNGGSFVTNAYCAAIYGFCQTVERRFTIVTPLK